MNARGSEGGGQTTLIINFRRRTKFEASMGRRARRAVPNPGVAHETRPMPVAFFR